MCNCNTNGTIHELDTCDKTTGQCLCKKYVTDLKCNECKPGFFSLKRSNMLGCESCGCNPGTSKSNTCDDEGQCACLPHFTGKQCDRLEPGYYVPNLHQLKYELEEGFVEEQPVNFAFNENTFNNFSWKGYVPLNNYSSHVYYTVNLTSPGSYKIIASYLNTNLKVIDVEVTVIPKSDDSSSDDHKTFLVVLNKI
jgi:laminin alpha 3/5